MYSDFDYKIKIVATNFIDFISNNWVGIVYKCLLLKLKPFPIHLKNQEIVFKVFQMHSLNS